jgi:hypothetical protein
MIRMPTKPTATAPSRQRPTGSPSRVAEARVTTIGAEKMIA